MHPALLRLTLLAIALSMATLSHAGDKVVGPGQDADTGSGSAELAAGASSGRIDTGSGQIDLGNDVLVEAIETGSVVSTQAIASLSMAASIAAADRFASAPVLPSAVTSIRAAARCSWKVHRSRARLIPAPGTSH